jgi:hypothetical protein
VRAEALLAILCRQHPQRALGVSGKAVAAIFSTTGNTLSSGKDGANCNVSINESARDQELRL